MIILVSTETSRRCALINNNNNITRTPFLVIHSYHLQFYLPPFNDSTTTTSKNLFWLSDSMLVTYVEHSCKKKLFFDTLIALPNWNTIQWYWSSDGYLPGWPPKCPGYVDVRNCSTTIARVVLSCLVLKLQLNWTGLDWEPFCHFSLFLSFPLRIVRDSTVALSVVVRGNCELPKNAKDERAC